MYRGASAPLAMDAVKLCDGHLTTSTSAYPLDKELAHLESSQKCGPNSCVGTFHSIGNLRIEILSMIQVIMEDPIRWEPRISVINPEVIKKGLRQPKNVRKGNTPSLRKYVPTRVMYKQ
uniref:Ovule protein n=1 Tax=Heterorhabditis bacteriophora TaxID=37862 RepID=A0A1I7XLX8_HETBA